LPGVMWLGRLALDGIEGGEMAFCAMCGTEIGDANFCPNCGAKRGTAAPSDAPRGNYPSAGIEENVASLLCYAFWWVSGLIFLLIDERPLVKFHGAQSIAFNVAVAAAWICFWIVTVLLSFVTALLHLPIGILTFLFLPIFGVVVFGTWILLMYKGYQGEKFKLPILGDLVEGMINRGGPRAG